MAERSDKTTTPKVTQEVVFSDFHTDFKKHPNSGNLVRVTNEASIKQALQNLLLTDLGERLFQPLVGGDIRNSLFEPMNNFTVDKLEEGIVRTIRNNEQRIDELQVDVASNFNDNSYTVRIIYTVYNSTQLFNTTLTLSRTR